MTGNEWLSNEAYDVAESENDADVVVRVLLTLQIHRREAEYYAAERPIAGLYESVP